MSPQEMQSQLLNQRAAQFAQMSPDQQLGMMAYKAGSGLGTGLAGAFGVDVQDPTIKRATKLRELASQYNINTAAGLRQMADALRTTDPDMALQLTQKAAAMDLEGAKLTSEQALAAQRGREKQAASLDEQTFLELAKKSTPASVAAARAAGNDIKLLELTEKAETKSEFERILADLKLPPEQERSLKQRFVEAKLNPDPSGLKSLNAQLASLQVQQKQFELDQKKEREVTDKANAIEKLSTAETSIDTALSTAEKALKLAPGSFSGAAGQATLSAIPWTDAKALKNLVSSLNSEKVISTLEQLKSQSRTGATGFGAVSEKELQLLLDKIRSLDPTDKMFKENLTTVMEGWNKAKQQIKQSRLKLQGRGEEANFESLINATIQHNKTKGNMTREQAIRLLKSSGKIPATF